MPARTARNVQKRRRGLTGMQLMASAACVGTIALAALTFLLLPAPARKSARVPPPETALVPSQVASPVQLPVMPGSEQQSAAAQPSITTEVRTMQAQVPGVLSAHHDDLAHASGNPPLLGRMAAAAAPPNLAGLPTTTQATNAPLQPDDTNREFVTLERSGVNIRSAPSASSRVVGSAPKGARFEVTNRNGHWLEIESDGVKGWISGRFVGPTERR
jgi:hypothetical protein